MNPTSYRESHLHKGSDYHEMFEKVPHRKMLWTLERRILDGIVASLGRVDHLDFACGTGRILAYLEDRTRSSTGVDISGSMLEVARKETHRTCFIEGDLTREPLLDGQQFDLITSFRFFPNAEPELRRRAIEALAKRLRPEGALVFNNHQSPTMFNRLAAKIRGEAPTHLMQAAEIEDLLNWGGLEIQERFGLGLLPLAEHRMPRPYRAFTELEWVLSRLPKAHRMAQNVIFLCRLAGSRR